MTDSVRVIIDLAPYRELSPNWSGYPKTWRARDTPFGTKQSWRAVAEAKRLYKELTYRRASEQVYGCDMSGREVLVSVRVGWPKGHKRLDHSNCAASMKAGIDGLTLSGKLWKDDNLVNVLVKEQLTWGEQDAATRALYPQGWVTLDCALVQP